MAKRVLGDVYGNKILIIDVRGEVSDELEVCDTSKKAVAVCDELLGADQVVVLKGPLDRGGIGYLAYYADMFNFDGSRVGTCANAMLCLAAYANQNTNACILVTQGGLVQARIYNYMDAERGSEIYFRGKCWAWFASESIVCEETPRVIPDNMSYEMIQARGHSNFPTEYVVVSVGATKHAVMFIQGIPKNYDGEMVSCDYPLVEDIANYLSKNPLPEGEINVTIARETREGSSPRFIYKTIERGVGITGSCGSGAIATVEAYHKHIATSTGEIEVKVTPMIPEGHRKMGKDYSPAESFVVHSFLDSGDGIKKTKISGTVCLKEIG